MKPIFLFDIDGTLLHVKRSFLFEIIEDILNQLGINKEILKNASFAGRTDKDIFSRLIEKSTKNDTDFDKIKSLYIKTISNELSEEHIDVIPGAIETAHFVRQHGYDVGLCTGNFKEVAFKKTEVAGLHDIFNFGGYGCNHEDRKYLPAEAHQSYLSSTGVSAKPRQYVVIGDTPNDIKCANYFGARSVAVTTGGFTREQLIPYQPDFILDKLDNPEKWITKLLTSKTNQK
jgi:phosphoglycolate phosphatase